MHSVPPIDTQLLLVVSASSRTLTDGRWQFVIENNHGESILEATDQEIGDLNRLTLLAAVRGLEAIDGGSNVTLLSHNRYLIRSLTDSLPRWRRSDFVWDHFGRRVEVQHADLWRRIDRTLVIHQVQACLVTTRCVSQPNPTPALTANRLEPHVGPTDADRAVNADTPLVRIDSPHSKPSHPASNRRMRRWLVKSATAASQTALTTLAPSI